MFDWKGFLFLNTAAAVVASVVVVAAADVVLAVADVVVKVVAEAVVALFSRNCLFCKLHPKPTNCCRIMRCNRLFPDSEMAGNLLGEAKAGRFFLTRTGTQVRKS